MPSAGYVNEGRQQFIGSDGSPFAGGRVFTYLPTTLTPAVTYQDPDMVLPNTNPIILDAGGLADIYSDRPLRQILQDELGNTIWDKVVSPALSFESGLAFSLANIAALQANTLPLRQFWVDGYYAQNDGGGGTFYWVPSDTTSPSDGGSIIIDAGGRRYYRDLEDRSRVNVRWWGARGNNIADDYDAIQACFTFAHGNGLMAYVPAGSFRTSAGLTLLGGGPGLVMDGTIRPAGGFVGLTLGTGGTTGNRMKTYSIRVHRQTISNWASEDDVGVRIVNSDSCQIQVLQAEGFTIGCQTFGDGRGFEDSNVFLGRIVDNKYGLDIRTNTATAWNNSVRYYGGHFACSSSTNTTQDRYGVRFSANTGSYVLHNAHAFYGPAFELQNQGSLTTPLAIPFFVQAPVVGRSVVAHDMRMEGNSPYAARHSSNMNDCVYHVMFASNGGIPGPVGDAYQVSVLYDAGVTRAGGSVIPYHQAAAAFTSFKLVGDAANIRSRAFRWNATETGFDDLAVLSSNPVGPPSTLETLMFPALSNFTLTDDHAVFPTSRAVVFVVDSSSCKEFQIAFSGSQLRPVIMQFDAAENVLGVSDAPILSNQSLTWNSTAQWWETTADSDDSTNTSLQRVTLADNCAFAALGVRSNDPAGFLQALRLYCPIRYSPQILTGNGSTNLGSIRPWGSREISTFQVWDPPSVGAGGTATVNVPVSGAVPGDTVNVGFTVATTLLTFGQVSAGDTVTVRLWNPTGAAVDLGSGSLLVSVTKPRV